jgi:hypothetical protein
MSNDTAYRRISRRETHSPRSGAAILLAVVIVLVAAWLATEVVLALLGQPALLVVPGDAVDAAIALPTSVDAPLLIAAGAVVAVIGLALILVGVLPGRRANHAGRTGRTALVIDNRAIASALARRAARAANVDPDQVVATVSHRLAEVRVRRTSGWAIDTAAVEAAVDNEIERLDVSPALRSRVVVESKGVVGA